jgi:hypothetical protein
MNAVFDLAGERLQGSLLNNPVEIALYQIGG